MCSYIEHYIAAAKENQKSDFEGLRVYGVLTTLTHFAFYSYDPISNTFCEDHEIFMMTQRDGFLSDMIHGMCPVS